MGKDKGVLIVLCTIPEDAAETLARRLVEDRLAACVNVIRGLTSLYWWEGKIQRDRESLLILKTTEEAYPLLERRIRELHPYTVPEIVALPVVMGNEDYLRWVREEVSGGGET